MTFSLQKGSTSAADAMMLCLCVFILGCSHTAASLMNTSGKITLQGTYSGIGVNDYLSYFFWIKVPWNILEGVWLRHSIVTLFLVCTALKGLPLLFVHRICTAERSVLWASKFNFLHLFFFLLWVFLFLLTKGKYVNVFSLRGLVYSVRLLLSLMVILKAPDYITVRSFF